MRKLPTSLLASMLSLLVIAPAFAAGKNDYNNSKEARAAIDRIIDAYGGKEQLSGIKKMKVEMKVSMQGREMNVTHYQAVGKIRREVMMGRKMIQAFDGSTFQLMVDGQSVPAPPQLREQLEYEVRLGVVQGQLLTEYMGEDSEVVFLGEESYEGSSFVVVQTKDMKGQPVEHYFDPATYLEKIEITRTSSGNEIQRFESYRTFKGVVYPEKVRIHSADGQLMGGMELVNITDEFDESVFRLGDGAAQ